MPTSIELHRFQDLWHGFVIGLPPGWRTKVDKEGRILAGAGGDEAVLLCPMTTGPGVTARSILETLAQSISQGDSSFQAWTLHNQPEEAAMFFSRKGQGSQKVRGLLRISFVPQGGALATGYQARADQLVEKREMLERVLASFQYVPPLARSSFIDPTEQAFGLLVPQGWVAQGHVDRRRDPHGDGAVTWVVDDPSSGARIAQESLVIDMVGSPVASAIGGLLGQLGHALGAEKWAHGWGSSAADVSGYQFAGLPLQMFVGQHAWKAHSFLEAGPFAQQVLLPMARPSRPDLQIEAVLPDAGLDALARETLRPVEMQTGGPCRISTGLCFSAYSERGVRFRECCILVNWQPASRPDPMALMMGAAAPAYWFCSMGPVMRAPEAVFGEKAPILEGIALSLRSNQAWESRESSGIAQRMNEERRQAENYRAHKMQETMDSLAKMDQEINQHRQATQAEIQRGAYNVLTGQEDVADSAGHSWKVESGWDTYWKKDGEWIGSQSSDLDTHLEANGWQKLRAF